MSKPIEPMSSASLHAMMDYLAAEVDCVETKEELLSVLSLARELFHPSPMTNTVHGLDNIRAEVDTRAIRHAQSKLECTVHLEVPQILSTTFKELSQRMRALQLNDPDTFANATSAMAWLANGEISTN